MFLLCGKFWTFFRAFTKFSVRDKGFAGGEGGSGLRV